MTERACSVPHGLPAGAISTTHVVALDSGWELTSTLPEAWTEPVGARATTDDEWAPAMVPGTVAAATAPEAHLDRHDDYDARDWWYRCSFDDPSASRDDTSRIRLRFDGLATLAEVWLNGTLVLRSDNMFVAHQVDVTDLLQQRNELRIAFRSVGSALTQRRPRPRWKTRLVDNQKLRWFRTTLLGRIPGWTPRIPAVGPWRGIWLEQAGPIDVDALHLEAGWSGSAGLLRLAASGTCAGRTVESAHVEIDERVFLLEVEASTGKWSASGDVVVEGIEAWWPRTHGTPRLYEGVLVLNTTDGQVSVQCGALGFRTVHVDRTNGAVQFHVNGVPVFCRGACWTTNDIVTLTGDPQRMRRTLELAADAHANMIRVGGTMCYETEDFYRACDELGVMVWQDFMFANMDYPVEDEAFEASVRTEAEQQLSRLSLHPSVVAWCGGSEVEQQAAMFGAPREAWTNPFLTDTLPALVERHSPGAPYWTSTPTGGALPFHTSEGLTHYYGVGAYRRPVEDCRLHSVRFTPECLGFSNLPEPENLRGLSGQGLPAPHDPASKAGVPRDNGAGWDFEDIRDHYLEELFGVNAVELRSHDPERYHRLSRTVTGRVMAQVFDEWRSPEHPCSGALVWFLNDIRPGAGWGIIDSDNRPKPAYWYLKRSWAPVRVSLLDRGLDGLRVEVHNEGSDRVEGTLEIVVYDVHGRPSAKTAEDVQIDGMTMIQGSVEQVLGYFADPTYAYRFGPRAISAVVASLRSDGLPEPVSSFYWATSTEPLPSTAIQVTSDPESGSVRLDTDRLARAVRIEGDEICLASNYVDLAPGAHFELVLSTTQSKTRPGYVSAENAADVRLASG